MRLPDEQSLSFRDNRKEQQEKKELEMRGLLKTKEMHLLYFYFNKCYQQMHVCPKSFKYFKHSFLILLFDVVLSSLVHYW